MSQLVCYYMEIQILPSLFLSAFTEHIFVLLSVKNRLILIGTNFIFNPSKCLHFGLPLNKNLFLLKYPQVSLMKLYMDVNRCLPHHFCSNQYIYFCITPVSILYKIIIIVMCFTQLILSPFWSLFCCTVLDVNIWTMLYFITTG